MTAREKEIYNFIKTFIAANKYPPSTREICDGVGLSSTSSVHAQLSRMKKEGFIDMADDLPRTITIPGMKIIFPEKESGR